ncbi:phage protein [Staphylococcus aureus]|nr:phage protein [Staphylococcus aureus DAR5868]CAC9420841.1 phage protein [Staphylococcus aureus]
MQHQAYINASVDIRIPTEVESVNYNQIDKEKENLGTIYLIIQVNY